MLSDIIIVMGENIKPVEKRFTDFLNRKAVRLTVCGVAAPVFAYFGICYALSGYSALSAYIANAVLFFIMFTALGGFFANIGSGETKCKIKRYAAVDAAVAAVLILILPIFQMLCCLDLEIVQRSYYSLYLYGLGENLLFIGITAVLSVTLGFFILRGKKPQP